MGSCFVWGLGLISLVETYRRYKGETMHILGAGRGAFLEFLRNLTPTILLISVAVVLWARLDFNRIDFRNWSATAAFYACALTAALSWFANISQFLDRAFAPIAGLERALRLLKLKGCSTGQILRALTILTWRRRPMIVIEALVVVLIAVAAVHAGAHAAVNAALMALRNGPH